MRVEGWLVIVGERSDRQSLNACTRVPCATGQKETPKIQVMTFFFFFLFFPDLGLVSSA
jgi:hypothetical protein